jgi:cytochrome c556
MKFASKLVVAAAAVVTLSTSAVIAQQDPIAARQSLMKENGKQAKLGAAMAKGEVLFDPAKAKEIFVAFQEAAAKMPDLFPPNSKSGNDTTAAPKIWENTADFKAKFVKFGADAKAAQASVKDLDSFKTAFASMGKECGGCHQDYRIKKN